MRKQNRLEFYYTDLEWSIAEEKAKMAGAKSLPHYLTRKLAEMKETKITHGEVLDKKIKSKRRKYYPTNSSWEILDSLAKQLKISPGIIVSRLFINPLLKND